jgi:hypothetical protein
VAFEPNALGTNDAVGTIALVDGALEIDLDDAGAALRWS